MKPLPLALMPPLASRETEPPGSGAPSAGAATTVPPSPRRPPTLAGVAPETAACDPKGFGALGEVRAPVRPGEAFQDILLRDFC